MKLYICSFYMNTFYLETCDYMSVLWCSDEKLNRFYWYPTTTLNYGI